MNCASRTEVEHSEEEALDGARRRREMLRFDRLAGSLLFDAFPTAKLQNSLIDICKCIPRRCILGRKSTASDSEGSLLRRSRSQSLHSWTRVYYSDTASNSVNLCFSQRKFPKKKISDKQLLFRGSSRVGSASLHRRVGANISYA